MRKTGSSNLPFSDHLGSSSVVMKPNGELLEKAYYLPWGGERGNSSITSTDYGYTGQMKEGDIYYYGARYYDPAIGRFMQADTIVPLQVQGTQAFDLYAYVNNNPMKYIDPSGHYACDINGVCFIEGWREEFLIYQGETNTCAISAYRMGASTVLGEMLPAEAVQNIWFYRNGGKRDWGIPPMLQNAPNSVIRNVKAIRSTGKRQDIIDYVKNDVPVMVTFGYPLWGHTVLAVGYDEVNNGIMFADSAVGLVVKEEILLERMENQIASIYPNYHSMVNSFKPNAYKSVDGFLSMGDSLGFVPPNSLTLITKSPLGYFGGSNKFIPGGFGIITRTIK